MSPSQCLPLPSAPVALQVPATAPKVDIPSLIESIHSHVETFIRGVSALATSAAQSNELIVRAHDTLERLQTEYQANARTSLEALTAIRYDGRSGAEKERDLSAAAKAHTTIGKDFQDILALAVPGAFVALEAGLQRHAACALQHGNEHAEPSVTSLLKYSASRRQATIDAIAKLDAEGRLAKDQQSTHFFIGAHAEQIAHGASSITGSYREQAYEANLELSRLSLRAMEALASRILPGAEPGVYSSQDRLTVLSSNQDVRSHSSAGNLLARLSGLFGKALEASRNEDFSPATAELLKVMGIYVLESTMPHTGKTDTVRSCVEGRPGAFDTYRRALEALSHFGSQTNGIYDKAPEAPSERQTAMISERQACIDVLIKQIKVTRDHSLVQDSNHTPLSAVVSYGVQGFKALLPVANNLIKNPGSNPEARESQEKFLSSLLETIRFQADVQRHDQLYLNAKPSNPEHTQLRADLEELCLALGEKASPFPELRHEAMWTVAWLGTGSERAREVFRSLLTDPSTARDVVHYAGEYQKQIGLDESEVEAAQELARRDRWA